VAVLVVALCGRAVAVVVVGFFTYLLLDLLPLLPLLLVRIGRGGLWHGGGGARGLAGRGVNGGHERGHG